MPEFKTPDAIDKKLHLDFDNKLNSDELFALQNFNINEYGSFLTNHQTNFPEKSNSVIKEIQSLGKLPTSIETSVEEIAKIQLFLKLSTNPNQENYPQIKINGDKQTLMSNMKLLGMKIAKYEEPINSLQEYLEVGKNLNTLSLEKYESFKDSKSINTMGESVIKNINNGGTLEKNLPNKKSIMLFELFLKMKKESTTYQKHLKNNNKEIYLREQFEINGELDSIVEKSKSLEFKKKITKELAKKYLKYLENLNKGSDVFLKKEIKQARTNITALEYSNLLSTDINQLIDEIFISPYKKTPSGEKDKRDLSYEFSLLIKNWDINKDSAENIQNKFDNLLMRQDGNDLSNSWYNTSILESGDIILESSTELILKENSNNELGENLAIDLKNFRDNKDKIISVFEENIHTDKDKIGNTLSNYIPGLDSMEEKTVESLEKILGINSSEYFDKLTESILKIKKTKEVFIKSTIKELEEKKDYLEKNKDNFNNNANKEYSRLSIILENKDLLAGEIEKLFESAISTTILTIIEKEITYQALDKNSHITDIAKEGSSTHRFANFSGAGEKLSESTKVMFENLTKEIVIGLLTGGAGAILLLGKNIIKVGVKQVIKEAGESAIKKSGNITKGIKNIGSESIRIGKKTLTHASEISRLDITDIHGLKSYISTRYISPRRVVEQLESKGMSTKNIASLKNTVKQMDTEIKKILDTHLEVYYKKNVNSQLTKKDFKKWRDNVSGLDMDDIVRSNKQLSKIRVDRNELLINSLKEVGETKISAEKILETLEKNKIKALKKAAKDTVKGLDKGGVINKSDLVKNESKSSQDRQDYFEANNHLRSQKDNVNKNKTQKAAANDAINPNTISKAS